MGKRTPLYEAHLKENAQMTHFFGWDMPLHYGSQLEEHLIVRKSVGVFDISHMNVVDMHGPDVQTYLSYILSRDIDLLKDPGQALYTCLLNEIGGIVDDAIVYRLPDDGYFRLVINSATHDKDLRWLQDHANEFAVQVQEVQNIAMIAVQGPKSFDALNKVLSDQQKESINTLKRFYAIEVGGWFFARTGYTGEDGVEIILPADEAINFWEMLRKENIQPCGLGARDTLRLEAGLKLYGSDMDASVTPYESDLEKTVNLECDGRNFIGKQALVEQKEKGIKQELVGLVLLEKGVLRNQQKVMTGAGEGVITSGTFSPTLKRGIAMARIPVNSGTKCQVKVRDKVLTAQIIEMPFVKSNHANFQLLKEGDDHE